MTSRPVHAALLSLAACGLPAPLSDSGAPGTLTRIAAVPLGAEVTGLFLSGDDLFFNSQHPGGDSTAPFNNATVGVVSHADFAAPALPAPRGAAQRAVTTNLGRYQILVQPGAFATVGVTGPASGHTRASDMPDFNGLVPTGPGTADLFTNWESRPGGMSRIGLVHQADGTWQVDPGRVSMLDFSAVRGTRNNCFGTVSPWGTPLSSEELYITDAENWQSPLYRLVFGINRLARHIGQAPNPYRYGYIVEITDPASAATPVKRVSLGRFSHENAVVMPDHRTVYLSDDGIDAAFFKFVADRAGDLSSGTLYAAKATQRGPAGSNAGTTGFDIAWVRLAHGTEAEIAAWIAQYDATGPLHGRHITDAEIAAWAAGRADDDRVAFLESRKAAAARGATAEFRKMEGVNANAKAIASGQRFVYLAMSKITEGMSDDTGDIQLAENKCGIVYQLRFDRRFSVTGMAPAIVGGPYGSFFAANSCDPDNLANPDNLVVRDTGDVIVGEDTSNHRNAALWLWRPAPG